MSIKNILSLYIGLFITGFLVSLLFGSSYSLLTKANLKNTYNEQLLRLVNSNSGTTVQRLQFDEMKFASNKNSNLYLTLYNEIFLEAQENAILNTAETEFINFNELRQYIYNGLTPASLSVLEVDKQASKLASITETYSIEHSLYLDLLELQYKTLALEMFANGSTSDSPFDLIDDLDKIERILFKDRSPSQFGDLFAGSSQASKMSNSLKAQSNARLQSQSGASPELVSINNPQATPSSNDLQQGLPPNALACPIDLNLVTELQTLNNREQQAGLERSENNISEPTLGAGVRPLGVFKPELRAFKPVDTLCDIASYKNDYLEFCIFTEKIYKKARLVFPETVDCVACAYQKIMTDIENISNQRLIPRKITGKLGEPSYCKKNIFENFSLNLTLVPMPARSDLDVSNVVLSVSTEDTKIATPEPLSFDQTAQETLSGGPVSLIDIGSTVSSAIATNLDGISSLFTAQETKVQTVDSNQRLHDLQMRLHTFRQYFNTMYQRLVTINFYLEQIANKKECSV